MNIHSASFDKKHYKSYLTLKGSLKTFHDHFLEDITQKKGRMVTLDESGPLPAKHRHLHLYPVGLAGIMQMQQAQV